MSESSFKTGAMDFAVLKKFNAQGPRYTSYPTAPMFSAEFTEEDFLAEVRDTNDEGATRPLSLYFHFPFCAKLCYFCGCNMKVSNDRAVIGQYNDYLKREIDSVAPMIAPSREVTQMHWGGGTPSHLEPDEIRDVGNYILKRFNFANDVEQSVEIDPRNMRRDHIAAFAEIGFNRTSFGVQDFDLRVQEAINRVQSEEITRKVIDWSRENGNKRDNNDLIYGQPFQTDETFRDTVFNVIVISPFRISVFNYAHVPCLKKLQLVLGELPIPFAVDRLS